MGCENVIISKCFYDEEAASAYMKKENPVILDEKSSSDKRYRSFYYYSICDDDWKSQKIIKNDYLHSKKFQFLYLKNVLKQIYLLRFVYDIETPLAIKMIRMSTLANMIFYPQFYKDKQMKIILKQIIISCGGIIYNNEPLDKNEKVYFVISQNNYNNNEERESIRKFLDKNPSFALINEKFILDSFYLMTNLKAHLNDPEYTFSM